MYEPLISIIIPTCNSEKTLGKCLESIKNQTYENIEQIVVDGFSRDRTIEISKRYGATSFKLNVERTRAKNFGVEKASGKYVLFIDSDMELAPMLIRECVDLMRSGEKIGGIIIPERSVGKSFWIRVRDFERSFYIDSAVESARFFRRDLFQRVGGFDEDIVFYEESTLPQKIGNLGYNVNIRARNEILHHEEDFRLLQWLSKKYYYGKTASAYRERYRQYGIKQTSIAYRLKLFLMNEGFYAKPALLSGILVLKFLEFLSVGAGFVVKKVGRG